MTAAERLRALPQVQRQALALTLLAVALAVAWYGVLKPLHRLLTSQEAWRIEVRRDLAERRGKAAIEARLAAEVESLHEVPVWRSFYPGSTEEEANAQIQQDLRGLGAASGISALALTPIPRKDYPDYIAYGVHINAAMRADQLKRFGDALRAAPHFLRVQRFAASAPQNQVPGQNALVNVAMDVYGYSRLPGTQAAPDHHRPGGSS